MSDRTEDKALEQKEELNSANDEPTAEDEGNMSIIRHLEELRSRLIKCLLSVAAGSFICWFYIDDIMRLLTLPAGKLYYMQPSEAFFTYIKVAVGAGFLLALPVIFFEVWRFFLPALTARERTVLGVLVPSSVLLFFVGLAFSFFLVLPAGLRFFLSFGGEDLTAMFSVGKYFDFVLMFILPFGFVFELPLVIIVLGKMGIVNSSALKKYWRVVVFASFVLGAIITPTPDIFTQSMIALPMIVLYGISYLAVRYVIGN